MSLILEPFAKRTAKARPCYGRVPIETSAAAPRHTAGEVAAFWRGFRVAAGCLALGLAVGAVFAAFLILP